MRSRVFVTVRCPSVCSSVPASACDGFAAERRAGRRYRSTAAGAQQQRRTSVPCRNTATGGPSHSHSQRKHAQNVSRNECFLRYARGQAGKTNIDTLPEGRSTIHDPGRRELPTQSYVRPLSWLDTNISRQEPEEDLVPASSDEGL